MAPGALCELRPGQLTERLGGLLGLVDHGDALGIGHLGAGEEVVDDEWCLHGSLLRNFLVQLVVRASVAVR